MARQTINVGTLANDGTGDTLRTTGMKMNDNFSELYQLLTGDPDGTVNLVGFDQNGIVFNGGSFDTALSITTPTEDRTIFLPDGNGTLITTDSDSTLSNKTLDNVSILGASFGDSSGNYSYNINTSTLSANRTLTLPILTANDTFVFRNNNQTLSNKTLSSPTINTARIGTSLKDTNGSDMINFTPTAGAVNSLEVVNSTSGNNPTLTSAGNDSDVTLSLRSKGEGSVSIDKLSYASDFITQNGAVDLSYTYHISLKETNLELSLGSGNDIGEVQIFTARSAGTITLTPTAFANGTSITIPRYATAQLMWNGFYWVVTSLYNATVNI